MPWIIGGIIVFGLLYWRAANARAKQAAALAQLWGGVAQASNASPNSSIPPGSTCQGITLAPGVTPPYTLYIQNAGTAAGYLTFCLPVGAKSVDNAYQVSTAPLVSTTVDVISSYGAAGYVRIGVVAGAPAGTASVQISWTDAAGKSQTSLVAVNTM